MSAAVRTWAPTWRGRKPRVGAEGEIAVRDEKDVAGESEVMVERDLTD
jgi:hypothetical protein